MRLFFPFSGDDVFISYSRRDENEVGERYAVNLYEELKKRGFSSFLDRLGTEPGATQPESLNQKIRNSKMLIIVGTERACQSAFVEGEIKEFLKARRIPIVPIDFNGTVPKARWYSLVEGVTLELEPPETLKSGIPSDDVIARIEEAFKYTKRNDQLRNATIGTLGVLLLLLLASVGASIYASIQLTAAGTAKNDADNARNEANQATEKAIKANEAASVAANKAELESKRANEQANIANIKAEEAIKATKLADEKDKLAQEKTILADEKTKIADLQAKRANEETFKAELAENRKVKAEKEAVKQELIATSRQLAVASKFASEKTQSNVFLGSYDPQRSVLLAIESLKILQTPEGMQSLHDAIMNLTDQAYTVELNEEEGDLSVSPNGKFLGIIKRDESYLRSIKPIQAFEYDLDKKPERFFDQQIPEHIVDRFIFSEDSKRFAIITGNTAIVRDTETLDNSKSFLLETQSDHIFLNEDGTDLLVKDEVIHESCNLESNCALSRNKEWMALLNDSKVIQIINSKTKKSVGIPKKLENESEKLALSNDGKMLAVSNRENVRVYKTDGWIEIGNFHHEWSLREINFSSDGQWLITITGRVSMDAAVLGETILFGSVIRVWNLNNNQLVMNISLAKEGGIKSYSFTADGKRLVTRIHVYSNKPDGEIPSESVNKEKASIWILTPDELIKTGCSLLSRNLSDSEWSEFILKKSSQTRETCRGLPIPQE